VDGGVLVQGGRAGPLAPEARGERGPARGREGGGSALVLAGPRNDECLREGFDRATGLEPDFAKETAHTQERTAAATAAAACLIRPENGRSTVDDTPRPQNGRTPHDLTRPESGRRTEDDQPRPENGRAADDDLTRPENGRTLEATPRAENGHAAEDSTVREATAGRQEGKVREGGVANDKAEKGVKCEDADCGEVPLPGVQGRVGDQNTTDMVVPEMQTTGDAWPAALAGAGGTGMTRGTGGGG
jgi:hypothetical protein